MIHASVTGVVQRMDFATGDIKNFAIVEFAGQQKEFEIALEDFKQLVDHVAKGNGATKHAKPNKDQPPAPKPAPEPPPPAPAESVVNWTQLGNESLPPEFKAALHLMDVPQELLLADLQNLVSNITQEFKEEDWSEVRSYMAATQPVQQPAPQPAPAPQPQPAQGSPPVGLQPPPVTWHDGSPVMPAITPARTVPKDEYGYPIVSNSDVDPGEIVASGDDVDEDGIGQM
jgi:hypothetical protein